MPVWLALMVLVVPLAVAVFFGLFAFGKLRPMVFHCRRCDRGFRGPPHRDYPRACPHCGATDWAQPTD